MPWSKERCSAGQACASYALLLTVVATSASGFHTYRSCSPSAAPGLGGRSLLRKPRLPITRRFAGSLVQHRPHGSGSMGRACPWGPYSLWLLAACFGTHDAGAAPASAAPAPCLSPSEQRRFSEHPRRIPPTNECMLNCTVRTYMKILRQQKRMTVRLHNSVTASENEYCWPSYLRCWNGEQLDKAFVFLDTDEGKVNASASYGLSSATATSAHGVQVAPQAASSVMSELCGIKFDTTTLFKTTASNFCVQVTCQDTISTSCGSLNTTLKCPPFLATVWSRF